MGRRHRRQREERLRAGSARARSIVATYHEARALFDAQKAEGVEHTEDVLDALEATRLEAESLERDLGEAERIAARSIGRTRARRALERGDDAAA